MFKNIGYKYFVNEKKRTVTCKIYFKKDECRDGWFSAYTFCDKLYRSSTQLYNSISIFKLLPSQCVAVAKCHPHDTFNIETGKRIARNKLRKRLVKATYKAMKKDYVKLEKGLEFIKEHYKHDLA